MTPTLWVRKRERRGYVKEAQGYTSWTEFQLIQGGKIVGRFDTETQAEKALRELSAQQVKP